MPRYIDADEVKKAIEESWDGCLGAYDSHEITMNDLWVIDKAPTADEEKIAREYCMKHFLVMMTMDTYQKLIACYNRVNGL